MLYYWSQRHPNFPFTVTLRANKCKAAALGLTFETTLLLKRQLERRQCHTGSMSRCNLLHKQAEYQVLINQSDVCRGVCGYFVSSRVSWFNEGKHSGWPCVMALRSGAALLKLDTADLSTYVSCCLQMLQGFNELQEKLFLQSLLMIF